MWNTATRNLTALGFTLADTDLAAGTITSTKFAAGAITATAIASSAFTAAKFAAGAVDAAALATDAVNEIVAGILAGTITELSSIPAASPSLKEALALLYMSLRNKVDVTATAKEIHTNAGTVLATKTLSDDGTTYSETKMA